MSRFLPALSILVLCCSPATVAATEHTLLVVLTHGDDVASIAPLLARYSAEGHTVHYAIFTGLQDPSGEDLLEHKPRKLYYIAYPESRFHSMRGSPFAGISETSFGTVNDPFITTRVDGSRHISQWQEAWYRHTATTLGGTVFLRLVLPAAHQRETDILGDL